MIIRSVAADRRRKSGRGQWAAAGQAKAAQGSEQDKDLAKRGQQGVKPASRHLIRK